MEHTVADVAGGEWRAVARFEHAPVPAFADMLT
jgi:hypothetical protein